MQRKMHDDYSKKIIFVCTVGHYFGYGHFVRCYHLAEHLKTKGYDVIIIFLHDDKFSDQSLANSFLINYKNIDQLFQKLDEEACSLMIFDLMPEVIISHYDKFTKLFSKLKSQNIKSVVIDGAFACSIRAAYPDIQIDLLIAPYIGENYLHNVGYKQLIGTSYYILPQDFKQQPFSSNSDNNNILITCGGSDYYDCTSKCIDALNAYNDSILNIQVVISKHFSDDNKKSIHQSVSNSKHQISIIDSPESLYECMLAADWVIGLSGLTKYEIASLEKPSILISPDEQYFEANKKFEDAKTALHYHCEQVDSIVSDLPKQINLMMTDSVLREELKENCRKLIDTHGVIRISSEIESLIGA